MDMEVKTALAKKHEAVRLRFIAPQVRFMAQRAASYGEAVLHKSLTMRHCFRLHFITPRQAISFRYEALRLRSV